MQHTSTRSLSPILCISANSARAGFSGQMRVPLAVRPSPERSSYGIAALCCCLFFLFASAAYPQGAPGDWTWVGGGNTATNGIGPVGVYGTLGTPAPGNIPGGRYGMAVWTDSSGNFWLFGGQGVDANGTTGYLNDLWKFSPSTNEWTWISGSSTTIDTSPYGTSGVYGTMGTPAPGNTPGGRQTASSWIDKSGNLWLFGGYGDGASGTGSNGPLNDLWVFNPSTVEWTWMGGSDSTNNGFGQAGIYGTQGTPSAGNIPGSRGEAATWTDSTGNVWLFGGGAQDANDQEGSLNDLWEYFPSTNQWAWMGGCNTVTCNGVGPSGSGGPGGVYGTMGTPAPGNIPGGRGSATNWIDSKGNFWIFGGAGQDVNGFDGVLNDVWEYTPSTAEWTWMGGSNSIGSSFLGQPGVYGTEGVPAAANIPGGRESSDFWTDSSGNFWLFGGIAVDGNGNYGFLNDLWEFSPAANEWTWMAGTDTVSGAAAGVYGTLGTPSPGNDPGGRQFSLGWTDTHGNLWLFGGDANDINGEEGYLNDAWEYQVSTLPAIISFVANPSTIAPGASSTLTGVFSNGTGVITPGNISVTSGTGVSVSPTATTTYTLTVTPTTGTAVTQTATVTVTTIVPTITSFVANPATITSGSSSTLTGVFSNGTGVITPGNISVTSGTGVSVSPTATTIYTLTVTPTAGTAVTKTTTVTVQPGKPVPAALTSPKSGSTFISNKVTFTWTAGVGATMYDLYLGTTVGSNNLYQTGHTTALSTTATVPTNGATVYARLLSYINGAWQFNDYTFTEGSMALLTSPVQGSTLTGASVTFKWTTGTNAADYDLYVGSTGVGSNNVYQTGHITATSATATNLPTTGAKLYVRLLSLINGSWQYVDYTFTEAMPAGTPAALTSPANGATLGSSNVTFTWTSGTDVTEYDLYLGTTVGSNNLYQTGHITAMTTTVPKIPSSGATVYARLLSLINGTWQYNDYTFTEP